MLQVKQALQMDVAKIQINLLGDKSLLLDKNVTIYANLEHRWMQVLQDELGILLDPSSGVFVCTTHYTPSTSRFGPGWRGEIADTVKDFVGKFGSKKNCYQVRLCSPKHFPSPPRVVNFLQTDNIATTRNCLPVPANNSVLRNGPQIVIATQDDHVVPQVTEGTYSRPGIVHVNETLQQQYGTRLACEGDQKPTVVEEKQPTRKAALHASENIIKLDSPEIDETEELKNVSKPADMKEINKQEVVDKTDDDFCAAQTQEETELVGTDVEVEDLHTLARERLEGLSNAFCVRAKNEIEILQGTNHWNEMVSKSPLLCDLLQELFKN